MDKIMMWVMAICALIGGVDQLAGNKFGLGRRFEDGFQLLGPTALSMAGLICITPLLSLGLEHTIVPLYRILHLDSGMLGGVLAIDMGGYQLCKSPADIRLDDVIQALEGGISPVSCLTSYCPRQDICTTREFWEDMDRHLRGYLHSKTLQDLVKKPRTLLTEYSEGKEI